jgi:hypothetical protein
MLRKVYFELIQPWKQADMQKNSAIATICSSS